MPIEIASVVATAFEACTVPCLAFAPWSARHGARERLEPRRIGPARAAPMDEPR